MITGPVTLDWYACDAKSGVILEDMPALRPSGAIGRKLGVSTTAQWDLDLNGVPTAWEAATDPGRTMLVAVDSLTQTPLAAYLVLTRAGGSGNTVQLGGASPEAYFDRRYTGTYLASAVDQAVLLTSTGAALLVDGPPFTFDAPSTGTTVPFYQVLDGDDRTVLSVWQEQSGQQGGAEWTVDVEWTDAGHTAFRLPARVRPMVGVQSATPEAVFDFPGCISAYTLTESYEAGKGATHILARGEGEGTTRLSSTLHSDPTLLAAGWPRWDYRYTPATGLTDPNALNSHAAEALTLMRTGSRAWTVEAVASRAPRLGTDWALGDSIRVQVERSPRHPAGSETVARAYAWTLDPGADRVTPTLLEDD